MTQRKLIASDEYTDTYLVTDDKTGAVLHIASTTKNPIDAVSEADQIAALINAIQSSGSLADLKAAMTADKRLTRPPAATGINAFQVA